MAEAHVVEFRKWPSGELVRTVDMGRLYADDDAPDVDLDSFMVWMISLCTTILSFMHNSSIRWNFKGSDEGVVVDPIAKHRE